MGFRFRKRLKIAPGVHLNISKSGISTSVGPAGLTTNLQAGKQRTTVGIPGSGLSYQSKATEAPSGLFWIAVAVGIVLMYWIFW
jgi:hypothetical protein